MSDVIAVVNGAQIALTLVRDLQRLVNQKHQTATIEDVQRVVQRNLDAELDWDASKAKRLAELEAASATPAKKEKPKPSAKKTADSKEKPQAEAEA